MVPVLAVAAAAAAPGLQPHDGLLGARRVPAAAAAATAPQRGPRRPVHLAHRPLRPQPDARGLPQRPAALAAAPGGGQRPRPAQGRHPRVSDSRTPSPPHPLARPTHPYPSGPLIHNPGVGSSVFSCFLPSGFRVSSRQLYQRFSLSCFTVTKISTFSSALNN